MWSQEPSKFPSFFHIIPGNYICLIFHWEVLPLTQFRDSGWGRDLRAQSQMASKTFSSAHHKNKNKEVLCGTPWPLLSLRAESCTKPFVSDPRAQPAERGGAEHAAAARPVRGELRARPHPALWRGSRAHARRDRSARPARRRESARLSGGVRLNCMSTDALRINQYRCVEPRRIWVLSKWVAQSETGIEIHNFTGTLERSHFLLFLGWTPAGGHGKCLVPNGECCNFLRLSHPTFNDRKRVALHKEDADSFQPHRTRFHEACLTCRWFCHSAVHHDCHAWHLVESTGKMTATFQRFISSTKNNLSPFRMYVIWTTLWCLNTSLCAQRHRKFWTESQGHKAIDMETPESWNLNPLDPFVSQPTLQSRKETTAVRWFQSKWTVGWQFHWNQPYQWTSCVSDFQQNHFALLWDVNFWIWQTTMRHLATSRCSLEICSRTFGSSEKFSHGHTCWGFCQRSHCDGENVSTAFGFHTSDTLTTCHPVCFS